MAGAITTTTIPEDEAARVLLVLTFVGGAYSLRVNIAGIDAGRLPRFAGLPRGAV